MAATRTGRYNLASSRPVRHPDSGTVELKRSKPQRAAGLLLSLAGATILMGSITAEALYPRIYTTHINTLSHLGATEPPDSAVLQPSAAIFDTTMLVAGFLILAAAWLAARGLRRKTVTIPTAILGLGVLGVGFFPLTRPGPHTLFALAAFYAGGVAVVLSARITTAPFRYVWMTMGTVALGAITLGIFQPDWGPVAELGEGGIERWNAYPIVLWLVAFGSYLMAAAPGRPPPVEAPGRPLPLYREPRHSSGDSRDRGGSQVGEIR